MGPSTTIADSKGERIFLAEKMDVLLKTVYSERREEEYYDVPRSAVNVPSYGDPRDSRIQAAPRSPRYRESYRLPPGADHERNWERYRPRTPPPPEQFRQRVREPEIGIA